ncbi:MAG TPA: flagellar basal body rod protein FlgC [Candidatus Binataceae bacterium]|nr:flagellar basal body rod protein FlgC [Candidatus Binataceae bacterium]
MGLDSIIGIANSALGAQSQRITLIAQNLANVDSINSPDGGPYQRRIPVFEPAQVGNSDGLGVKLAEVVTDQTPPRAVYDPSNPFADESGVVKEPAVNPVYEMVDMMQASRSYQANLSVVQTANAAALKTIDLLK